MKTHADTQTVFDGTISDDNPASLVGSRKRKRFAVLALGTTVLALAAFGPVQAAFGSDSGETSPAETTTPEQMQFLPAALGLADGDDAVVVDDESIVIAAPSEGSQVSCEDVASMFERKILSGETEVLGEDGGTIDAATQRSSILEACPDEGMFMGE